MSNGEAQIVMAQYSNGTIHKRVRLPGVSELASLEACNLDQAGPFEILPDIGFAHDPFRLCARCYPADEPETGGEG